jgi:RNase P subunit RPR2
MICTRCKELLVEGKNVYRNWHVPICTKCRQKMRDDWGKEGTLTKREITIMEKRLKEDKDE